MLTIVNSQQVNYWSPLTSPTPHHLNRVHFTDSTHGWISGAKGVFMHTSNGGGKWFQQLSGSSHDITDFFVRTPSDIRAMEIVYPQDDTSWYGTRIHHSINGGNNWTFQLYDSTLFKTMVFLDSLTGFMAGSYGTIAKTTDAGNSWRTVSDTSTHKFPINKIKFYSKQYGFAVGGQLEIAGIIWKTTDGGESWRSEIVSTEPIFSIHYFDSSHVLVGMAEIDQASGIGFLRSHDAGESWNFELPNILGEPMTFAFRTPTEGWVPMGIGLICLRTTNEGISWDQIQLPQPVSVFDISFPDAKTGYLVGRDGTLMKFNSMLLSVEKENRPVRSYALLQNYPNPFNGRTTFQFQLPSLSFTRLIVYDLLGREIAVVVNEELNEGIQQRSWDAGSLPSGVYLYRLSAARFQSHGKLLIQK